MNSAWVSNCVGHFNHRYFVLFLLYLFMVCAYGALMSYSPFMDSHRFSVVRPPSAPIPLPLPSICVDASTDGHRCHAAHATGAQPWVGLSARGTIVFIFVLSVAVGLAVGLMLAWHLYLVLTGQTTIEFYFNRYRMQMAKERGETYYNEFDLGYRRNWDFFFGKGKYVVRSFAQTLGPA